jgi:predicted O-methyltransferase YrrM
MKYEIDTIDEYFKNILDGICFGIKPRKILETGIRSGLSTSVFLKYINDNGTLISVDRDSKSPFLFNYQPVKNHQIIIKDSLDFLSTSEDTFDLIFLDDWHSKDHVLKEIELCENLIHERSLILIHDAMWGCIDPKYNFSNHNPEFADGGVAAALLDLDRKKWEFCTIPFSHGITILRKIQ